MKIISYLVNFQNFIYTYNHQNFKSHFIFYNNLFLGIIYFIKFLVVKK